MASIKYRRYFDAMLIIAFARRGPPNFGGSDGYTYDPVAIGVG